MANQKAPITWTQEFTDNLMKLERILKSAVNAGIKMEEAKCRHEQAKADYLLAMRRYESEYGIVQERRCGVIGGEVIFSEGSFNEDSEPYINTADNIFSIKNLILS